MYWLTEECFICEWRSSILLNISKSRKLISFHMICRTLLSTWAWYIRFPLLYFTFQINVRLWSLKRIHKLRLISSDRSFSFLFEKWGQFLETIFWIIHLCCRWPISYRIWNEFRCTFNFYNKISKFRFFIFTYSSQI